jgi:hypothetical protein
VQLGRNQNSTLWVQPGRGYRISMSLKSSGRLLRTIAVHHFDSAGKEIRKAIVVPRKLVNLVV